ncbi:hypothetical protein PYCCODRAFT_475866 [Trametes coccinea BRFM310]|uniref:STI1 domain-containing protein n=1 Tax=Trametes coccinea (strain BRFM310) TaxID=1353009 RepID=A0A1Y2IKY0_TRAC3|nr:hypothetical protein PYCCODRAFT_475866 [Trametes coccinea BRFM310]
MRSADERGDGAEAVGLGKLFGDPNMFAKLAANPRTAKHLADPAFVQKLQAFQQNPKLAETAFQSDPRMIDVLGALMGLDMQGFTREEGSNEMPPGVSPEQPAAGSSASASSSKTPEPPKPEPPKQEDVEMAEPDEDAEAKKEAEEEKKKGADAYKNRDFDNAIVHFQKAWDIYPKDITFLTNLAAAYFEKGDYDKCIETCDKAVEQGRETSSLSQRRTAVPAPHTSARVTSPPRSSSSISRLPSTARPTSSTSSALRNARRPSRNVLRTSIPKRRPSHVRRAMRSSRAATSRAP